MSFEQLELSVDDWIDVVMGDQVMSDGERDQLRNMMMTLVEDEENISRQMKMLMIYCAECKNQLCGRGMKVMLVADQDITLYSTDLVTQFVKEINERYVIGTCLCEIRNVACVHCDTVCGYHVVGPCSDCLSGGNNGHYWLFHDQNVVTSDILDENRDPLTWQENPDIGRVSPPKLFKGNLQKYVRCPVCFDVISDPYVLKCGHSFCKVCIYRELDLRRQCPLDRIETDHEEAYPNMMLFHLINELPVHCRNGFIKSPEGQWVKDDSKCCEYVRYENLESHEAQCSKDMQID